MFPDTWQGFQSALFKPKWFYEVIPLDAVIQAAKVKHKWQIFLAQNTSDRIEKC